MLKDLAVGLRVGAEQAGVEIPGGEVCQLPEVIRGHPSPRGFDLVGSALKRKQFRSTRCTAFRLVADISLPAGGEAAMDTDLIRRIAVRAAERSVR